MSRVRTQSSGVDAGAAVQTLREWTPNLSRLERQGRTFVDERPLMALMIAVAGGYCLGRMLSRV
jgi:hypothetical protein